MARSHGTEWTDELIAVRLVEQAKSFGRMPTAGELRARGMNDLACVISRRGGFLRWAKELRLETKGTETHRGQKWERSEAGYFAELGFEVEEQTTKAPFDLLVGGRKVDVKTSTLNKSGWFQFGSIKRCVDCEFLDLLCVDGDALVARFIVPAEKARVVTISMMPATLGGLGKYAAFRSAVYLLRDD